MYYFKNSIRNNVVLMFKNVVKNNNNNNYWYFVHLAERYLELNMASIDARVGGFSTHGYVFISYTPIFRICISIFKCMQNCNQIREH